MFVWQQERQEQMILIGSSGSQGKTEDDIQENSFCDFAHFIFWILIHNQVSWPPHWNITDLPVCVCV